MSFCDCDDVTTSEPPPVPVADFSTLAANRYQNFHHGVWLRQIDIEPTSGLRCKITVYGLNGHRAFCVID